jgi:uncharacterized membrane protein
MVDDLQQAKRPVSAVLAGPYGHPLHPVLVTVPIGAWVAATVFDVASHVVDDPGFLARGAQWLIAVGVLGALAAAVIGFLDLLVLPAGTRVFRTALVHMGLNLTVTCGYVGGFLWRRAEGGAAGPVAWGPLVLSLCCLAVLAVSGFLGGKLAFRYGVRVADEAAQVDGYRRGPADDRTSPAGQTPPAGATDSSAGVVDGLAEGPSPRPLGRR